MKFVRTFSRIITGVLFIFSGFVKAVDPLGLTYKLRDYFSAFNLDFLNALALPIAIFFITLELFIGLSLFLNIRVKFTSWLLLIIMSYFTVLTFILAIFNPVSDCGCFGDALILTNWQTFWKNVIFFVPTIVIFLQRKEFSPVYKSSTEWILSSAFVVIILAFIFYNYLNLPILDFRPYKTGTNISEKMVIPEGKPVDKYEFTFIYEKNGERKEFSLENIPDSTWTWIETKQKLITKGYEPPIHDFSISTLDGDDITKDVLNDPDYSILIAVYNLDNSNLKAFNRINKLYKELSDRNCSFYCLTASTTVSINNFSKTVKPEYDIYITDEITLKTMIRSNPGIILLKEGTIIGKWPSGKIPENMNGDILAYSVTKLHKENSKLLIVAFIAVFFVSVFLFLIGSDILWRKKQD